jgi:hypothetical protein
VRVIVAVGEGSIFISLVLTALTSLLLGMGIPDHPELHHHLVDRRARARRARRAAHRLAHVRLLFRHHGGPDAARGARGLRRRTHRQGDGAEDRLMAVRIGAAGFVVPFMAVYSPALMLQPGDPMAEVIGFYPAVVYVVAKALMAVMLWGVAIIGYLRAPVAWWERIWALAAASTLVLAMPITDEIGCSVTTAAASTSAVRPPRRCSSPPAPASCPPAEPRRVATGQSAQIGPREFH